MHVTRLATRDDLLAVTGPDDYARYDLPAVLRGGLARGRAVGVLRETFRGVTFTAWGAGALPADVAALFAITCGRGSGEPIGYSVPRGFAPALTAVGEVAEPTGWDWCLTRTAPPPQPGEEALVALDDLADAAEITEFARGENPRFEGRPGTGVATVWVGARVNGRLVACGAAHRLDSGVAHLAGILVASAHRGRGWGRAVTAALTRAAIARDGVCTLSLYADNPTAAGLYRTLGYATVARWDSGLLRPANPRPDTP